MLSPTAQQQSQKNGASAVNGTTADEVSTVQPVSLRQGRGARLSFLGGRKKDSISLINEDTTSHPDSDMSLSHTRNLSKDNPNRRSFFRAHANDNRQPPINGLGPTDMSGANGAEWLTDAGLRESSDGLTLEKDKENAFSLNGFPAPSRVGSVRKRLSLLKIGGTKKPKGNGTMGSLDEE